MEEAVEEGDIEEKAVHEGRRGKTELSPKAAEIFAVSKPFDRNCSGGRYLFRALIPVRWQRPMDGGTGKQHTAEKTRDR